MTDYELHVKSKSQKKIAENTAEHKLHLLLFLFFIPCLLKINKYFFVYNKE